MRTILVLFALCLPLQAYAGCWECGDNDRCAAAAGGADGHEGCWSFNYCTTICEPECSTSGGACIGSEKPGEESQGWLVPNGAPLDVEIPAPARTATESERNA